MSKHLIGDDHTPRYSPFKSGELKSIHRLHPGYIFSVDLGEYVDDETYERWRRVLREAEVVQDEIRTARYQQDADWRARRDAAWADERAMRHDHA